MNFRAFLETEVQSFIIIPLIDILLTCLIYFAATSTMAGIERQASIKVPTAEQGKIPDRPRQPYFINITRDGTIYISNRIMTQDELKTWLKDLHDAYAAAPPPVVIRADRDTAFQHFVKVLDACAGADIRTVAYANIEAPRHGR
jgi:biopolymer transport protein ExbD